MLVISFNNASILLRFKQPGASVLKLCWLVFLVDFLVVAASVMSFRGIASTQAPHDSVDL